MGVIGAGNFASRFLIPDLNSKVEKIGLCSYSSVSSKYKAEKFNFDYCTTDSNQIIDDPKINTVIISTRHNTHAELVLKCIDKSKNVYVDKPLALNLSELDAIRESMANNNKILMVGFNRRFSPLLAK